MKMVSSLIAAALFSSIAVANAAEPVTLTDTQLDEVAAGQATADVSGTATAAGLTGASISIKGAGNTQVMAGSFSANGTLTINSTSK